MVTNDVPATMKEDDYYMKEEEKIPNNENNSKENNQEDIDKLFFEELKKMNEVIKIYILSRFFWIKKTKLIGRKA